MTTYYVQLIAESPLQIGAGSLGMIELCQCHIPGRVIWGALVNTFCNLHWSQPGDQAYRAVGEAIPQAGLSTFFPLLPVDLQRPRQEQRRRFIPCFPLGQYVCEERPGVAACAESTSEAVAAGQALSTREVEGMMLTSIASTATSPLHLSATDQTLHSNDLISPFLNLGPGPHVRVPTAFAGYLELPDTFAANGATVSVNSGLLRTLFSTMRIGGGRKRGWGMVCPQVVEEQSEKYPGYESVAWSGRRLLTRETPVCPGQAADGRARLQSFREYDHALGSGRRFSVPKMVWDIGTVLVG